ncbi:MAG TPA: septal ring lytic transglycosylase RlpA family protein [Actinomycetota bacterium]|nr:septal ring lytic transglycosylase RlpA family protein [Actinomycetota bacterium]
MKKLAITAIAAVALPLTALPSGASPDPAPAPVPDHLAGGRLAALLSTEPAAVATGVDGPVRIGLSALRVIEPVKIAIRPADLARAREARERAKAVPRRVESRAARSARSSPPTAASSGAASASGGGGTLASWYNDRPSACWDRRGRHAFPKGLTLWTAHKTLPCGTAVAVTGPAGTMTVRVYDRGPYVAGRGLDLSAAAFRGVCGSTSRGVCRVSYRVAS